MGHDDFVTAARRHHGIDRTREAGGGCPGCLASEDEVVGMFKEALQSCSKRLIVFYEWLVFAVMLLETVSDLERHTEMGGQGSGGLDSLLLRA